MLEEIRIDEAVNGICATTDDRGKADLARFEWRFVGGRLEGESFLPGETAVDPVFQERDFFVGQPRAFRRHLLVFVAGEEAANKFTFRAVANDDGGAALATGDKRGTGIHRITALLVVARVALAAMFTQDGDDVVREIDWFCGDGGRAKADKTNCNGRQLK